VPWARDPQAVTREATDHWWTHVKSWTRDVI